LQSCRNENIVFLGIIYYISLDPKEKRKKEGGKKRKKERKKEKENILCFSFHIPMSPMRPGLPISGLQIEIPKLGPGSHGPLRSS
jgi:hypothetical protein